MRVDEYKRDAERMLLKLREGSENYAGLLKNLRQDVEGCGLMLENLGTNEEELEELRLIGSKLSAVRWLKILRKSNNTYLSYLLSEIEKGGFALEEIGTNDEEIRMLKLKECVKNSGQYTLFLESSADKKAKFYDGLKFNLNHWYGLSLDDFDTSVEAINALMAEKV